MSIGFGIIGCGMIADFHARAIADVPGAKLVTCTSRTPEKSRLFAKRHGIEASTNVSTLVHDKRVDVVSICTPSGSHMEPALAAIRQGKHVVVEKPLEISLSRCDRMLEAAEKARVLLTTIFQSRHHPASERLKLAVDQGRFGTIMLADAYVKWHRPQSYYDRSDWKGTWKQDGGGALMNQAIHALDLLRWLMGPVESVTAHAATRGHERIEVEDVVVATLRFASGALGTLEATTGVYLGLPRRIEISGTAGMAILRDDQLIQWEFSRPRRGDQAVRDAAIDIPGPPPTGGAADPSSIGHLGHARQYRDIVRAIQHDTAPRVGGVEGRHSVEVTLAIYRAARTGRTIRLTS